MTVLEIEDRYKEEREREREKNREEKEGKKQKKKTGGFGVFQINSDTVIYIIFRFLVYNYVRDLGGCGNIYRGCTCVRMYE